MKKLNNKGMTIVEIVVTFVMLMVLVLGMLNLTNEIKTTSKQKQFYKELTEYSSLVQSTIQDDLIKNVLTDVSECNVDKAEICLNFKFKNSSDKQLIANVVSNFDEVADGDKEVDELKVISYDGLKYIIPMSDYINDAFQGGFSDYINDNGNNFYTKVDNILIIDVPIFENLYGKGNKNFGFRIVHLIEE